MQFIINGISWVYRQIKWVVSKTVELTVVVAGGALVGLAAKVLGNYVAYTAASYAPSVVITTLGTAGGVSAALVPFAPFMLVGAVVGLVGYGAWKLARNQGQSTINVRGFEAPYRDLGDSLASNEIRRRVFNLTEYSPQYLVAATELLREKFRENREYTLDSIVIKPNLLADLQRLISAGLGRTNARHLEICDTTLGDQLVSELCKHVMQDRFLNIETLILRNNNLTPTSLVRLNEIGRRLNLRTLDISGNFTTSPDYSVDRFEPFIRNFHKNFTSVRRLYISNINSGSISSYITELWAQPGMLEFIDFSENGLGTEVIVPLLNDPIFQFNVNIREIQTGCNESNRVSAALASRAAIIDPLRRALGETQETSIVTAVRILELLRNEGTQPLPNELTQYFARTMPSNETTDQTFGNKWRFFAEKFNAFHVANNPVAGNSNAAVSRAMQIENSLVEFYRNEETDQDFLIRRVRRRLAAAQPREVIMLSLRHPYATRLFESAQVVAQLENGLESIYGFGEDDHPVIRRIDFPNIGITTTEFSSLLTAGLGDYDTVELNLENNKLDDECISELGEHDTAFSKLKSLNLSRNSITQNGLVALANFCRKVGVESLNISGNALCVQGNQYSDIKVGQFLATLHTNIPTLRVLNISNIGLMQKSLSLLSPLILNISLLEEVDAGQSTIKRSDAYAKFYNQPAFLNNLILRRFDMGNVNHKNIREKIVIRQGLINNFRESLPEAERGLPILPTLLTKYLMKDSIPLPPSVKAALDHVVGSNPNSFSNGNKIEIMATNIRFHRDKARITNGKFEIPQRVTAGEIVAYKEGKLTEYWSSQLGKELVTEGDEMTKLRSEYQDYCKENRPLKAIVMAHFESEENEYKIYYVEDDSIRVCNNGIRGQFICSRYLAGRSEMAIEINIVNGVSLILKPNGNVELQINDRTLYLNGYDVFSDIPCEMVSYNFQSSHVTDKSEKAEISDDIEDDEETIKLSGRPMTHQYDNHRRAAANQPMNYATASSSSSSSSSSGSWPSSSSSSSSVPRQR